MNGQDEAAEVAELRQAVAELEAPSEPAGAGPGEAAGPDPAVDSLESCRVVCQVVAGLVHTVWPVLEYPPELIEQAAQQLAPLTGRPWFVALTGGGDLLGRWAPEISAGVFFGTIAVQSIRTVRESRQHEETGNTIEGHYYKNGAPGAPGQAQQQPDPFAAAAPA